MQAQQLADLSSRLLDLVVAGDPDMVKAELGKAMERVYDGAIGDFYAAKPIVSAIVNPALNSPQSALRTVLMAWLHFMGAGMGQEQMKLAARVMVEFAGRMAWMAELEDPLDLLRYSIGECNHRESADFSVDDFSDDEAVALMDVSENMDGALLAASLQQLVDMECRYVYFDLPTEDSGWVGGTTAPCGHRFTENASQEAGPHALLHKIASAVGEHLRGKQKPILDS